MKKSVLLAVFLILALIILSFCFSVYAQSGSVSEKELTSEEICSLYKKYDEAGRPIPNAFILLSQLSKIGCSCIPKDSGLISRPHEFFYEFARSNYMEEVITVSGPDKRSSDTYCYTTIPRKVISESIISKAGSRWVDYDQTYYPGEIRECTNDQDTDYEYNIVSNVRNLECHGLTPFCNDKNICSECLENIDCLKRSSFYASDFKSITNHLCMAAKYEDLGENFCSYCKNISGNGDIVITIAGDISKEESEFVIQNFKRIQPFKYLDEKGRLKFNYVEANLDRYSLSLLDYDSKCFIDASHYSIKFTIKEICPDTDVYIYFNQKLMIPGSPDSYFDPESNLIVINNYGPEYDLHLHLAHQMGHFYDLGDEHFIENRLGYNDFDSVSDTYTESVQVTGNNIDICYCVLENCACNSNKFSSLDEESCYPIKEKGSSGFIGEGFCKSTPNSIMNEIKYNSKFNIISCATILEKTGESKEKALSLCKQWACELDEPIIRQSKTVCKN